MPRPGQLKLSLTVEVLLKIDICSDLHVDRHHNQTSLLIRPGEGPSHWPVGHLGDRDKFFHFDFGWYRTPGSNVLVIAGDISDHLNDVQDVVTHAAKFYDHVVITDGNHEHHGQRDTTTVDDTIGLITDIKLSVPNLIYLDGGESVRHDIGRTAFIGGNCWYDWKCYEPKGIMFPEVYASWDDHSSDVNLDFGDHRWPNVLGDLQIEALLGALESANRDPNIDSVVVVTHSAPLAECLNWHEDNRSWNVGSPSYVNTNLAKLFAANTGKIKLWAYGHTHTRRRWSHEGVTLVNNCYGYPRENLGGWAMANVEVL